jgi:hypothetical protein
MNPIAWDLFILQLSHFKITSARFFSISTKDDIDAFSGITTKEFSCTSVSAT